jgi:hypothetical protein
LLDHPVANLLALMRGGEHERRAGHDVDRPNWRINTLGVHR